MSLVCLESLVRGAVFLDCALSIGDDADAPIPSSSDIIGMTAAALAGDCSPSVATEKVARFFGAKVAERMNLLKEVFDRDGEGGLWVLGPAYDDVIFKHPLIKDFYPHVNARREALLGGEEWGRGSRTSGKGR